MQHTAGRLRAAQQMEASRDGSCPTAAGKDARPAPPLAGNTVSWPDQHAPKGWQAAQQLQSPLLILSSHGQELVCGPLIHHLVHDQSAHWHLRSHTSHCRCECILGCMLASLSVAP